MAGAKALFGALSNLIPKSAYRSRLEPAIEALPQEKMTPEQALGSFKNFPGGVGEDELQYTGIKGILEQGQPVTKTSLLEQVRSNPLEITDVYKADAYGMGDPKYSQYTLPGGSNYQELLMTLPTKPVSEAQARKILGVADDTKLSDADIQYASNEPNYRSSHYDEPNILAHGRYNTRTIDGDKTLFIEEIQSDLHQAGRDKGYKPDTPSGVFDAPYKSTDKWAGLTFNRMLKQAVDSGHDRIAWTSGQIQADRYDLSEKISKIEVTDAIDLSKSGKGSGLIYNDNVRMTKMRDPDGSAVMDLAFNKEGKILQGDGKGKNLSEVVGKELAEKLINSKGSVNFSGDDLSIGGEGMKEFYDKILPKISGKIAKKYNSKVEVSADSLYDANPDLIQGTGRNRIDAIENARDEVRYDGSGSLVPDADEYKAIQNGDVWEAYFDYDVGKGQQVWSMKITPEMKKAVAGGVALSGAGVAVLPEGSE